METMVVKQCIHIQWCIASVECRRSSEAVNGMTCHFRCSDQCSRNVGTGEFSFHPHVIMCFTIFKFCCYHLLFHEISTKMPRNNRMQMHLMCRWRLAILLLMLQILSNRRNIWVHPLNNLRFEKGEFYTLYPDLRKWPSRFYKFYRMSLTKFDRLLGMLQPYLVRTGCNYRQPIEGEQRLVSTIT